MIALLQAAWSAREKSGAFKNLNALRVFHGPAEGEGVLAQMAIDRFGPYFWITEWEDRKAGHSQGFQESQIPELEKFLKSKGAQAAVILLRPEKGVPAVPRLLFGKIPEDGITIEEDLGAKPVARFQIRLLGSRHPGLFLDHLPLRQWLRSNMKGLRVLNTFSYTGSLSVSAGLAPAAHVTTLDLSKPTIRWATENWQLNELPMESARFISGDYFEWLPRLKREGTLFDCVILDPPSFSRGNKGTFSTSKDLKKLHALALDVLKPGGFLVSSINSANVSREDFEEEISAAVSERGLSSQILKRIELPATFPVAPREKSYLKGLILRISSGSSSRNS